jgi:hypothetical protein
MSRVSISTRAARAAYVALDAKVDGGHGDADDIRARSEISSALSPKHISPLKRLTSRKTEKRAKKATKRDETYSVRAQVAIRAQGVCECGCGRVFTDINGMEMDHFWGRGKVKQSVTNCWALALTCHREKTNNIPSRLHWLQKFQAHCEMRRGYQAEVIKVDKAIAAELDALELPYGR